MKNILIALVVATLLSFGANAQGISGNGGTGIGGNSTGSGLTIGAPITGSCTDGFVLYYHLGNLDCEVLAGGGNVSASGTPTAGQYAEWTNATTIKGTSFGANVAAALGIAIGSAGAPVLFNGAGGTPSSLTGTNITGTASGLTAGIATVANGLKSATTTVVVSAATAPTAGQVLTATSGTAADWETLSASATSITPGTTTIVGVTAPCVIANTATTVMGCLAYGATGNTTIVQTTSGGLLTPSILPVATTSALGGIKPDGLTLVTAAGGVTSTAVTDITHAGSFSLTNVGGQDTLTSSGTVTLPTLTATQSFMLVTASGATATLTVPGGVTLAGAASQATLPPLSFLSCAYQSATVYDCASGGQVLTLATGLPISTGVSGLGTGVATAAAIATNATGGVGTIGTSGATVGLLNGTNTFSGTQTFGAVVGGVNVQTGTTYTLAATDCGRAVHVSNGSAITVTTFQAAVVGCVINVVQGGAGQITFANGGSATLVSAHSYTKTFAAAGATVSLAVYVNSGSAAVFTLTGDGA